MRGASVLLLTLVSFACLGSAHPAHGEAESECDDRLETRNVYFGDLHVHSSLSMDAYVFGTRVTPSDAYRFARGQPIEIRAILSNAERRAAQLLRPLDFAAVTDHAEYLGAAVLCVQAGSTAPSTEACQA